MDFLPKLVVWLLVAEAGILALSVLTYLAVVSLRGRDVVERVQNIEGELDGMEARISRAMKRLSPGRPSGGAAEENPDPHPAEAPPLRVARRSAPANDRATRMAAVRAMYSNGRAQ